MTNVKTRFMYNSDLERVVEIDTASGHYQWGRLGIVQSLCEKNVLGIVASNSRNKILGFCVYDLKSSDSLNMLHIAVDAKYQRKKIGAQLIDKMKSKLNCKRNCVEFMIPENNMDMQLFLKAMKFKSKLVRGSDEDLIQFTYCRE